MHFLQQNSKGIADPDLVQGRDDSVATVDSYILMPSCHAPYERPVQVLKAVGVFYRQFLSMPTDVQSVRLQSTHSIADFTTGAKPFVLRSLTLQHVCDALIVTTSLAKQAFCLSSHMLCLASPSASKSLSVPFNPSNCLKRGERSWLSGWFRVLCSAWIISWNRGVAN